MLEPFDQISTPLLFRFTLHYNYPPIYQTPAVGVNLSGTLIIGWSSDCSQAEFSDLPPQASQQCGLKKQTQPYHVQFFDHTVSYGSSPGHSFRVDILQYMQIAQCLPAAVKRPQNTWETGPAGARIFKRRVACQKPTPIFPFSRQQIFTNIIANYYSIKFYMEVFSADLQCISHCHQLLIVIISLKGGYM